MPTADLPAADLPTIDQFIARLLVVTALFAWIDHRYLRLPKSVGIMAMGICASLLLIALELVVPQIALFGMIEGHLRTMNFSYALLHGMLAFLLFAGAIQIDLPLLRERAWIVGAMATLGVIISTVIVGVLLGARSAAGARLSVRLGARLRRSHKPDRPGCGDGRPETSPGGQVPGDG